MYILLLLLIVICYLIYISKEGFQNQGEQQEQQQQQQQQQKNAMIIVEPREHKLLQYVIENFNRFMDPSWDLYVFYGNSTKEYAENATQNVTQRAKYLLPLGVDNLIDTEYNTLFKQHEFWDKIDAENILVFQTDAVLCPSSAKKIEEFIKYDYIGCSVDNKHIGNSSAPHWWSSYPFYGIGGLSFRKKSFMKQCITNDPNNNIPEDVFYSTCIEKNGRNKPESAEVLAKFCSQWQYNEDSFGAHKTKGMSNKEDFYAYCPEAQRLEEAFRPMNIGPTRETFK